MSGSVSSPPPSPTPSSGAPGAMTPSGVDMRQPPTTGTPSTFIASPAGSGSTAGYGSPSTPPASPSHRVYSPTETENWVRCPIYRQFKKHWTPRPVEWDPAILLGKAVQEGLFSHLRGQSDTVVEERVVSALQAGFEEQPKYTVEGLEKLALRGVEACLKADLFSRHTVLMVDEPLSQSRPDVVSRHETEGLGVTDFKVSRTVDERYRASRLDAYDTDSQFWHYAWEVGETLGEPVLWLRPVLIILTPKAVVLPTSIKVTPERVAYWLQGAEQHWRDMSAEDQGTRPIVPRWQGCHGGRWPCEFNDFCHRLGRDPEAAAMYYERVG